MRPIFLKTLAFFYLLHTVQLLLFTLAFDQFRFLYGPIFVKSYIEYSSFPHEPFFFFWGLILSLISFVILFCRIKILIPLVILRAIQVQ